MGRVTNVLVEMLKRQVTDRGIVVWYDPQKVYFDLVKGLALPDASILRFENGFFSLRELLETFLEYVTDDGKLKPEAELPPTVVVYVPMAREDSGYALIEAETAGVVMEPGAVRPECNTRLGTLVERIFEKIAPAKAAHLARQADNGLLTLDELDRLAEDAGSSTTGALQVIFDQASAEEIILQFVASDSRDQAIVEKNVLAELAGLIHDELGLEETVFDLPTALRTALRLYLLLGDLLLRMPESELPETLGRLPIPAKPSQRDMVSHLCNVWRNRMDLKDSYVEASEAVEQWCSLSGITLPLSHLRETETFPSLERRWLDYGASVLIAGNITEALETARTRLPLFWPRERPTFQIEWKVIEAAAELCREAERIKENLKKRKWTLDEMVEAYACHAEPWMRLDRVARQLETRYARLDTLETETDTLEKVVVLGRQRYADTLDALAQAYLAASQEAEFSSRRFRRQTTVFKEAVRPALEKDIKTAYLLVDALRYEMAVELLEGLQNDYEVTIEPILGQLPGITSVGMAALLPHAEQGMRLEKDPGGIVVLVQDIPVSSRQARMAWLTENASVPVVVFRLGEVIKLTPKKKKEIAVATLIVVTSQEIDRLGEEGTDAEETRLYMEDVLEKLRRAVRSLSRAGVQNFVITADHGFLFLEATDPGLAMDPPGGVTVQVHPRVWIGQGGGLAEGYYRFKASDLELGSPLELAFPRGMGTFKVKGGAGAYYHGGISLQEQVLPLARLKARVVSQTVGAAGMQVKLSISRPAITNRLFTVKVELLSEDLFAKAEKWVRFELIAGKIEVGLAATAAYEFEEGTREVLLKHGEPNAVTFMITATSAPESVTIHVVDCDSQLVLDALKDVPVQLGI